MIRKEIRLSKNHLVEALFNHASVGILLVDKEGVIRMINPFAIRQFGYQVEEELLGQNIDNLVPQRVRRKHVNLRDSYAQSPSNRPMGIGRDLSGVKKDGTEFPVEVSLGHFVQEEEIFVIAFINDITRRKQAENQLRELNEELERKVDERSLQLREIILELKDKIKATEAAEFALLKFQKMFNEMVDNYPEGSINIIDKDYNYVFTGGQFHKLSKTNPQGLIGKRIFPWLSDESWAEVRNQLARVFQGERFSDFELFGPLDGHLYALDAFPIRNLDGTIDRIGLLTKNISALKKAEEELRVALRKEQELGELKSRFVSIASHEFRTPLSTVLSSTYLLSKYTTTEDQPKREKHIARIISSVNLLNDILNDFLSVGKIEEGKIQVKLTEFNLREYLGELAKDLKEGLGRQNTIDYEHTGNEIITLDSNLLRHIAMNLISNASTFSPERGTILMRTVNSGESLRLSVRDQGIGISKEDQEHLFERFFRAKNATEIQGTGLGLHIVSKYVELLDGIIEFNSELGKGTEFIITFNLK
ncbi:MAG: PAS domain S-box protein [Cyclobacteriaceae bacterium]